MIRVFLCGVFAAVVPFIRGIGISANCTFYLWNQVCVHQMFIEIGQSFVYSPANGATDCIHATDKVLLAHALLYCCLPLVDICHRTCAKLLEQVNSLRVALSSHTNLGQSTLMFKSNMSLTT